ncbi:MAG TPA: hypothetical protein VF292_09940 [Rhodanobacteraceae bacterium]
MNAPKLIAIAVAVVINVGVFALFTRTTPIVDSAPAVHVHSAAIPTLPMINVYPSASELRELRHERNARHLHPSANAITDVDGAALPHGPLAVDG